MILRENDYLVARQELMATLETIVALEEKYMHFLATVIVDAIPRIVVDFDQAHDLLPFWINYPPQQRGRAPSGTSIPWSEVGETAIGSNIVRSLILHDHSLHFPGLPSGADIRCLIDDAIIHLDIKLTGPNDRPDEIVASPNQLSGDGKIWRNGVINSPVNVVGQRTSMTFQPELPPFYMLGDRLYICLTYFLKGVYTVEDSGEQPLDYLELICVPNGLLTFDGRRYAEITGLFIPGKDTKNHRKKRTRVRMEPLSEIASWRRMKLWQQ